MALRFAEELLRDGEPSFETVAGLKQHFDPWAWVEMTLRIGYRNLWNWFTDTFKPEVEDRFVRQRDEVDLPESARQRLRGLGL